MSFATLFTAKYTATQARVSRVKRLSFILCSCSQALLSRDITVTKQSRRRKPRSSCAHTDKVKMFRKSFSGLDIWIIAILRAHIIYPTCLIFFIRIRHFGFSALCICRLCTEGRQPLVLVCMSLTISSNSVCFSTVLDILKRDV